MADIFHEWGSDLATSATGDLVAVSGTQRGEQRLIRRLMTNLKEAAFAPSYGAGMGRRVGDVLDRGLIEGIVRGQIHLEAAVARFPVPVITVEPIPDGVFVRIQYADALTGQMIDLPFEVTP